MKKTRNAVQILNRKFCKDTESRKKIEDFSINIQVSELIYKTRTAEGLTQQQLADRIGTKQSVIARLENADYEGHSAIMLQKIASALNKKIYISFQDFKTSDEVIMATSMEPEVSINNLSQLLFKKLDNWMETGWKTLQELKLSLQLPQVQTANARSSNLLKTQQILEAEKLAENDPNNPLASVRMAKEFNLLGKPIALVISVFQVSQTKLETNSVNVLFQIHSLNNENLPSNLQMMLLNHKREPEYYPNTDKIITVSSDGNNRIIAFLPLVCQKGENFGIQMSLNNIKLIEEFVFSNFQLSHD